MVVEVLEQVKTKPEREIGEPLRNMRHELFARKLIEYKGERIPAYQDIYPGASYDTAKANACELLTTTNIRQRCIEILNETTNGKLPSILKELSNQVLAEKGLATKRGIQYVRDNPSRLDAIKTTLKLYGTLGEESGGNTYNTQINNITIDDAKTMDHIATKINSQRVSMLAKYKDYDNEAEVIL
jgi:hypothetical protein